MSRHLKYTDASQRAWLDNGNRQYIRPSFDEDPVSFLVALADQVQDFGRMSYETCGDHADLSSMRVRYPVSAVEMDKLSGALGLTFDLGSGTGDPCFAPKDDDMVRKITNEKHRAPGLNRTAEPDTPWLRSGSLYTEARIVVRHNGKPVPV